VDRGRLTHYNKGYNYPCISHCISQIQFVGLS
jgi:hypothetical protein